MLVDTSIVVGFLVDVEPNVKISMDIGALVVVS